MKYLSVLFLTLFTFSFLVTADEIAIPKAAEDLVLTKGLPAKDFFGKRAQASTCRNQWQANWNQYLNLKKELDALVAAKAPASQLDPKEAQVVQFRKQNIFELTEECGPCATQEIIPQTVHAPTGTQDWLISDGSCFVPGKTQEERDAAFKAAVHMLSHTELFARQRGGFESVLEFVPISRKTGAFLPHTEITPGSVIDTFIAVRGPLRIAFNYLFENKVELIESADGTKEFIVRFTGLRRPDGFKPKIQDITLAGTKRSILTKWDMSRVIGMWYVRNDGYYRYFTAADFESPLTVGTDFARTTLLDTVMTLSERGR